MSKDISFHFKGGEANAHTLSVDYVINLLEGIRDLSYLTVAQQGGTAYNERFRPSKQIKDSIVIRCKPAEIGSYAQTLTFDTTEPSLLPEYDPEVVCSKVKSFFVDLAHNAGDKIEQAFPNSKLRLRAIKSVRKAIPPADSVVYVDVDDDPAISSRSIHINSALMIEAVQNVVEDYMTVVTGRLTRIDFDQKKLVIQHPVTRRFLDCYYNEEVEPMLLEHPRELIQVTGNVVMDENDMPKEISDVVGIHEVDLSPIEVAFIEADGLKLRFKQPTSLRPELDDSEQLFVLRDTGLGLDFFAYTRGEIVADIQSEIVFLWKEYALADDAVLSDEALSLKRNILTRLEEVPHE